MIVSSARLAQLRVLGLRVKIEDNLKIVHTLAVTLNLTTRGYAPDRKSNDSPLYIHKESNHPLSTLPAQLLVREFQLSSRMK